MTGIAQGIFGNKTLRDSLFKLRFVLGLLLLIPLARYMHPNLLPAGLAVSLDAHNGQLRKLGTVCVHSG